MSRFMVFFIIIIVYVSLIQLNFVTSKLYVWDVVSFEEVK